MSFALIFVTLLLLGCGAAWEILGSPLPGSQSNGTSADYQLVFVTQPTNAVVVGQALATGGVVQVQSLSGQLMTTGPLSNAVITIYDSTGAGNIAGSSPITAVGGIATLPTNTFVFERGGTKNLAATSTISGHGTATGISASINVSIPAVTTVSSFSGVNDPNGDLNGNGTSAKLYLPNAITTDGTYVYIYEDAPSCVIRRYDIATTAVVTWAGQLGQCSVETDGAFGTNTLVGGISVTGPVTMASDSNYIYITGNETIRRISITTGVVQTIAGSFGVTGSTNNATGTSAQFNFYNSGTGLWVNSGNLYVSGAFGCVIRQVSLTAPFPVTNVAGNGTCGLLDSANPFTAHLGYVMSFTADATNLYFVDFYNVFGDTFQLNLRGMNWGSGAITTYGVLQAGSGLFAVANNGSAVVGGVIYNFNSGDPNLLLNYLSSTTIDSAAIGTWTWSQVGSGSLGDVDGGVGAFSMFGGPVAAFGTKIYFADTLNGALRVFNTVGNTVTTLAGTPNSGLDSIAGTAANSRYAEINDVVSDGTYLYVYENMGNDFRSVALSNGSSTINASATSPPWNQQSMAMVGSNLYIADTPHTVSILDRTTWTTTLVAGTGGTGDVEGPFNIAQFPNIQAITSDQNNLYVYDNYTIKKLNFATQTVSILSGNRGSSGCVTGSSASSQFDSTVQGMVYLNGYLYFTSPSCFANGIVRVSTSTGASSLYAGNGTLGFANGPLATAEFQQPSLSPPLLGNGITTDGVNLYVYDAGNGMVREINVGAGTVSTLFGSGALTYTQDGALAAATDRFVSENQWQPGFRNIYYGYGKLYLITPRGIRVVQ